MNQLPHVIILMPYDSRYIPLLELIRTSTKNAGATADRIDEQNFSEDIVSRIINQIEAADGIVAVMTGNNPNVFFEVGIAYSLGKRIIFLIDNAEKIPFDLQHLPHLQYGQGSDSFQQQLEKKIRWSLTEPNDNRGYFREYKAAFEEVSGIALDLTPYFSPIAMRYFNEWSSYVNNLVGNGIEMRGPERLKITRLLAATAKLYRYVETDIGDPLLRHSKDWISFYDAIGANEDIEKIWILCASKEGVRNKRDLVAASFQFWKNRNFRTLFCTLKDIQSSIGGPLKYQVIEDFGKYVKHLTLQGTDYTSGASPNTVLTTIRKTTSDDQDLIGSIIECAELIDDSWLASL